MSERALPRSPWRSRLRLGLPLLLAVALGACSSTRPWINPPLEGEPPPPTLISSGRDPSLLVAVTLSGGGARAAAFGYGVLQELHETRFDWNGRQMDLLEATDVITGVSGGSILAAYYAAFGAEHLGDFERDFLRQNFQNSLITQTLRPDHLYELTSPWFGRSHLLARRLDQLYQGRTYGDISRNPRHPQLVITATDMSLGTGFEFTAEQFGLICSDLRSVPLSFAVASSSAVPIVLSPMTLRNHADECRQRGMAQAASRMGAGADDYRARMYRTQENSYLDAHRRPYIHLVDGGLADNLGVRRLLDRAIADGGLGKTLGEAGIPAGTVRHLVLITVNSERDPSVNVDQSDKVPNLAAVADALLFGAGARATTETQEYLADLTRQWRSELQRRHGGAADPFAADASIHVVQVNLRDAEGEQRRRLLQVPTAFTITDAEVSGLINAGRQVLRASPEFKTLSRLLNARRPVPLPPPAPLPAIAP